MGTFTTNYYPDEIAESLCQLAGVEDTDVCAAAEDVLYDLKSICENELNKDKFRTLYRLLEAVTKEAQRGLYDIF